MAKYRKKPVVIEAWSTKAVMSAAKNDWAMLPVCIAEAYEKGGIIFLPGSVSIKTLEGWHEATPDSVIIRGVQGELYSCKNDIFAATYEQVN